MAYIDVKVKIKDFEETLKTEEKTTLYELAQNYRDILQNPILLALVDNEICELCNKINKKCTVQFLDITHSYGFSTYRRSLVFVAIYCVKKIFGDKTKVVLTHSLNNNHYFKIKNHILTNTEVEKIFRMMKNVVNNDMLIERHSVSLKDGIDLYGKFTDADMRDELRYIKTTNITMQKLGDFHDYMYGPMVYSTGCLNPFSLVFDKGGFILQVADKKDVNSLSEIKNYEKLSNVFVENAKWAKILNVTNAKALNDSICNGSIKDVMYLSEAFHEKKLAEIADKILINKKNIVLIAGPSSSGKTTFAERLCIQLRVNGIKPYVISLDDYYLDKCHTPLDEFGKPDFECIEAIDVEQFNKDLQALLNGEEVQIPKFNFFKGCREYTGRFIKLTKDEVLVIEGIHGLNEKLSLSVPRENKFKIYISALTQLNINDYNRIATTDARLIRRIVRDHQFRGFSAESTIDIWPSVLRGEQKNIFPYQEEADIMFNSALVYELAVLKPFAEPLLFNIDSLSPEYSEAKRLIKFLNSFLVYSTPDIPKNSILREFIGESCFQ